jgi:hypothetical protein
LGASSETASRAVGRNRTKILVFLIWQLPRWLLFGCKNSQIQPEEAGRPFGEGEFGDPVRYRFLTKGELTSRRG